MLNYNRIPPPCGDADGQPFTQRKRQTSTARPSRTTRTFHAGVGVRQHFAAGPATRQSILADHLYQQRGSYYLMPRHSRQPLCLQQKLKQCSGFRHKTSAKANFALVASVPEGLAFGARSRQL